MTVRRPSNRVVITGFSQTDASARSAAPVGEPVRRVENRCDRRRVARAVAGIVDDHELRAGPRVSELPRNVGRAADVEMSVDQDTGYAGQTRCITQELTVFEKRGVAPVVGDQPGEAHAEACV